jgi:hypothetical protein
MSSAVLELAITVIWQTKATSALNLDVTLVVNRFSYADSLSRLVTICTICFNTQQRYICVCGFHMIPSVDTDYFLNCFNQLIFVMEKCGVFFEVRIEFLNIVQMKF